jgi:hypothetical protein
MSIVRNDILPSKASIPKSLQAAITRAGGKNPFGEPMFRLVLAESRVQKASGAWNQWRKGTSVDDRYGLGLKQMQKMVLEAQQTLDRMAANGASEETLVRVAKTLGEQINEFSRQYRPEMPESTIIGMTLVPVYTWKGFILEKWKPAENFGSPEVWYSFRFQGEAALGPYPTYGDYELCAGPTPYLPTAEQCIDAIKETFRALDERPTSPQARMSQMLAAMEEQEKELDRQTKNMVDDAFKEDAMLYKTVSTSAGRARNVLAKKAGVPDSVHCGN